MSLLPSTAYHVARLLLLIDAYSPGGLAGLTKLAKLDFLIRYPTMLHHLTIARGVELPVELAPTAAELTAVESQMIRWKYGPWDQTYYPLIGTLIALGLVTVVEGSVLTLRTTALGREIAANLREQETWSLTDTRSRFLRQHFNMTGNALRLLIYAQLPQVAAAPFGERI